MTSLLNLAGATMRVGGRTLWSEVDFELEAGEFVAVLGPNGAGKSTLIKAVLGQSPVAAGSVTVLDRPAGEANRGIGYLPQRRTFDPSVRIRGLDVVRFGLDGNRWGFPLPWSGRWSGRGREKAEQVREMIELVGAEAYAHRPIGRLSGGEQQRLLIAQALVANPRLLLLDEPLDSLDLPNQAAIAALISRVCQERGVGVLMVAHDVNPIIGYLDRVIYLAGGRAAAGKPEEVITARILSDLYGSPVEVIRTAGGQLVVVGQPEAPALHGDRHGGSHDDRHGDHDHVR
jgi:zinc/manganese transport system ATP-binding protein